MRIFYSAGPLAAPAHLRCNNINKMQKIDKLAHAVKVVARCLPPVALIGLTVLSHEGRCGGFGRQTASTDVAPRTSQRRMTARPAGPLLPFQPGRPIGKSTTEPAAGPIGR